MKKFTFVMAAIVFCMAATQQDVQGQTWTREKLFTTSRIASELGPPLIGFTDSFYFGNFQGITIYSPGLPSKHYKDTNVVKIIDNIVYPEAHVRFSNINSRINDYVKVGNDYYACAAYGADSSGLRNRLLKKDPSGKLVPVLGLKINGMFKISEIVPGKLLLSGVFTQVEDKNGIKTTAENAVVWDIVQQEFFFIGDVGLYASHSIGSDSSVMIITTWGNFKIAHYGSTEWQDAHYAPLPFNCQLRAFALMNKNLGYGAWRVADDRSFRLVKMKDGVWSELGTLYKSPVTFSADYDEMKVTAVEPFGDKLIISHTGTHFNGVLVSAVFSYDTKTGEVQNLPVPVSSQHFGTSYVKVVNNQIYFVSLNGFLLFGEQTVWKLNHDGTLPVTLSLFTGVKDGGSHKLIWTTQSEENVSHFEVESSSDGSTFSKVVQTLAHNRASRYEVRVPAKQGTTFYRLKMVDKDGTYEYSRVIALDGDQSSILRIFPNPVTSSLQVQGLLQNTPISIIDMDGRVLRSQALAPSQRVDVSSLPKGIYFLKVGDKTLRFVK